MVIRTAIVYPDSLPGPSVATIQAAERRMLTPAGGPFDARTVERDRRAIQQISFPPFTDDEAAAFKAWFDVALVLGGAWFAAVWPLPQGFVTGVRRFMGKPNWKRDDAGFWNVSGPCEVRGRGMLPYEVISDCMIAASAAEVAMAEPFAAFLWWSSDPDEEAIGDYELTHPPIAGTYASVGRLPGVSDGEGGFPIAFVVAWADLLEPPGISIFNATRAGNYPTSVMPSTITVTGAPDSGLVAECRACIFQTVGSWSGGGLDGNPKGFWATSTLPITFPGGLVMHPLWYDDGGGGPGVSQAAFLLRADGGSVTGVPVS